MNERIQELIKQCTSWSEGSTWTSHEEFDKEKFAELIVRECLVQIGNAIPDTDCSSSGPYKTARIAATSRVKEHFGVEE